MRDYSKVSSGFWVGSTGRKLRANRNGQIVAMYLMTSKHANMIGMYQLPLGYISGDTGLSMDEVRDGMAAAIDAGFCDYDHETDMVWVYEMVRFQVADSLNHNDKQARAVQNLYDSCVKNKFTSAFWEKYGEAFGLTKPTPSEGEASTLPKGNTHPFRRVEPTPSEGNSPTLHKPVEQKNSRTEEQKSRRTGEQSNSARATVAEVIPIDPPKQKTTIPPEIKPVLDGLTAELMDANRKKSRSYKLNPAMLVMWPAEFHDLMESRGLSCQELVAMLRWSQADDFWNAAIQSPADLAKHLDKIAAQMKRKQGGIVSASQSAPPVGEDLGEGFVRVG